MPTTTRALCATELRWTGDLWFSPDPADRARAKTICARCPLTASCATAGLSVPGTRGVWGGLDAGDRATHRGADAGPNPDDEPDDTLALHSRRPCGTEGAYKAHRLFREDCEVCDPAHAARVTADRLGRLEQAHAEGGTEKGAATHRQLGEKPCPLCGRASLAAQFARDRARRARQPAQVRELPAPADTSQQAAEAAA